MLVAFIVNALIVFTSWAITSGFVWLATLCFGIDYSVLGASVIWAAMYLYGWVVRS